MRNVLLTEGSNDANNTGSVLHVPRGLIIRVLTRSCHQRRKFVRYSGLEKEKTPSVASNLLPFHSISAPNSIFSAWNHLTKSIDKCLPSSRENAQNVLHHPRFLCSVAAASNLKLRCKTPKNPRSCNRSWLASSERQRNEKIEFVCRFCRWYKILSRNLQLCTSFRTKSSLNATTTYHFAKDCVSKRGSKCNFPGFFGVQKIFCEQKQDFQLFSLSFCTVRPRFVLTSDVYASVIKSRGAAFRTISLSSVFVDRLKKGPKIRVVQGGP